MSQVIAIRPEPGLTATIKAGREQGLDIRGIPLFEIRAVTWQCPEPDEIDALLIGSANAMLHGGAQLESLKSKPVYAVGEATAQAARDAGFTVAARGVGGLQNVLDEIDPPLSLLRIAGAEHVTLSVPSGVQITTVIAYESVAQPLDPNPIEAAGEGALVLLHSAAAARHFANECNRLGLYRDSISLAVLGPRIASAAGKGWHAIHVAEQPNDASLLELAREMCI